MRRALAWMVFALLGLLAGAASRSVLRGRQVVEVMSSVQLRISTNEQDPVLAHIAFTHEESPIRQVDVVRTTDDDTTVTHVALSGVEQPLEVVMTDERIQTIRTDRGDRLELGEREAGRVEVRVSPVDGDAFEIAVDAPEKVVKKAAKRARVEWPALVGVAHAAPKIEIPKRVDFMRLVEVPITAKPNNAYDGPNEIALRADCTRSGLKRCL